ncbi:MAG: hypothetical protein NTZ26_05775 [Candidatus Aminicenantes bacterium]|nr:hypothetical protein [Candidatus Aminicenantes bacterium]
MRTRLTIAFVILFALTAGPSLLTGQSLFSFKCPGLDLVYYNQTHTFVVSHLARCFTATMGFYKKFFDYQPAENTSLFLQDYSDWGNGGATAVPKNLVFLELSPFQHVYDMMPGYERMSLIMNHELVHVVTMDKPVGSARFFRSLFFGKVMADKDNPISMAYAYLTSPRTYTPRWYVEGIAVFMETWMDGGLGRALGSYDEMIFRTKVLEDKTIYDAVGLESEGTAVDFQIGAISYLYGTRFFTHLALKYGPQKVVDWTSASKGSKSYFAAEFKRQFGRPLAAEWGDWVAAEKVWQEANLALIRKNPVTPFTPLTRSQMGSVSRAFYDPEGGKIYAGINFPGQVAHIAALDTASGRIDRICDIKGAMLYSVASLAYDRAGGRMFFTTDNSALRDLAVVDLKSGRTESLIKDARIGDLAFNPADQSLWGIRHNIGLSTIVKIEPPYRDWTAVCGFDYFTDIYDMDLSPDGAFATAAVADVSGAQKLVRMKTADLLKGLPAMETLYDFGTDSPADFRYSPDGRFLFGSSYYTGASNIFRYDFAKRSMEVVSNAETGFFRPIPVKDDALLVFKFTDAGFVPGWIPNQPVPDVGAVRFLGQEIVQKYPIVKTWLPPSPASVPIESLVRSDGPYNSWRDIRLNSIYPIVEGYKDSVSIGLRADFRNPLRFNGFDLSASYTPNPDLPAKERPHLALSYHYWNWTLSATVNGASFYDLFGPTKVARKGYSLALAYSKYLVYDTPRTLELDFQAAGYWGLDKLPDYQNIDATYDRFLSARIGLRYTDVRKSLGAVDEEKGYRFHVFARSNFVNGHFYPRLNAIFDYGLALPIKHSSLWLRTTAGQSFGDRTNNFVNFYFGGFGNNWIDYLGEKRYREFYSFPGLELNALGGRNYARAMLEWTLPAVHFRRFGFLSLFCNWARLAFFASGIVTDFDNDAYRRQAANIGVQLDLRVVLFSLLNTTVSFGYARAQEKGLPPRNEFMFSLKLL